MRHYGIGELTAVTILAELGDCTRFSSSRQAVRYAGMDITVYQSDQHRAPGHLSRQGPPALRWALYEAAQVARPARRTATTTSKLRSGSVVTARAWPSRASS
jgi:transposase